MSAIHFEQCEKGIVWLTLDAANQSANTMNAQFRESLAAVMQQLKTQHQVQKNVTGVVIQSAKSSFFAGGDLDELVQVQPEHAADFFAMIEGLKQQLRDLETLGLPVVACLNGSALGGGWELALSCHHRIALNNNKAKFGLPEVTLGLLPGAGGIVRMVRLLGLQQALPLLLEGKQLTANAMSDLGLIHALVDTTEQLREQAIAWILAHPQSQAVYDVKGYKIPDGDARSPKLSGLLAMAPAMLKNKTKGCYPAPEAILATAVESTLMDINSALRLESRAFTKIATGQVAKNMIGAFWHGLNAIKAGASRPKDCEKWQAKHVGVIGAGMMGAGIAYAAASRGIQVHLNDVSLEKAEHGKAYSKAIMDKKLSQGRCSNAQHEALLQNITATDRIEDLANADLIVEAVFENMALKHNITTKIEPLLPDCSVMASNTSTLPITELASVAKDAKRFIGLHFFSPVDKMQLVEIIRGQHTSDETLAKAFDFVQQLGKIPVVVNDSRGFYTSRVFGTYVQEGMRLLAEGVDPALIEMAALKAGMPVGPLALQDEVSISLTEHIAKEAKAALEQQGITVANTPVDDVVAQMIHVHQRPGKAAGAGFYDYPKGAKKQLWSGLKAWQKPHDMQEQDLIDRFLFIQALESLRCYQEGILDRALDANIASIFGIGYPAWTGGAIAFLNQYGLHAALERSQQLTTRFGERFTPPKMLIDHAALSKNIV